jgi:O-antigen/teichoic acid export membrane protein
MTLVRKLLSAFNLGHASFVGSSALVQLFPLMTAPVIARLYTPAEFGIYAVFFALSTILAGVSALALTNATLLEAEDGDAAHATLLAMTVVTLFCALLMILMLAVPRAAQAAILGEAVVPYLPWIPVSALLSGIFTCLYTWAIRVEKFHLLGRNRLVLGISTVGLQIGIGLMDPGAIGFILANLCGYGLAVVLLVAPFVGDLRRLRPSFTFRSGLAQLKKHQTLPLWTVPANLVNSVCSFLPDLVIGRLFGVAQLGQFSLASRMVNFPLAFIATSAQDIFRQQAAQEFNEHGHCRQTFNRFFILMAIVAIALLIPIILIVPYVFPIIFGSQWDQSGALIQAIGLLLIVRFVSSPLSYVWIIRGHQKLDFLWQAGLMLISLTTFLAPPLLKSDITLYQVLWVYSVGVGAWYVFCLLVSRHFAYSQSINAPGLSTPV